MKYYAIFKDGSMLKFDSLDWLHGKKHIEYILKKELFQTIKNTPRDHYNYRYNIINADGTPRDIKIGKFELVDIGVDTRYFRTFEGREISLFDLAKKTLRKFTSMTENEDFIVKDLLPTFEILKLTNSWDIYVQLREVDALKSKVDKLNSQIEKHKETISDLKSQLENCKASSK